MVDGMSIREASRMFGVHRETVRKMLVYPVPPGYRMRRPRRRPKLEGFAEVIDRILRDDLDLPRKQRHTAKRIHERLRDEHGFDGEYTTVKDYVREQRIVTREMFVPRFLSFFLNTRGRRRTMLSMVAGVAITRLTLTKINRAEIPLPPINVQQAIVAEIEAEQVWWTRTEN